MSLVRPNLFRYSTKLYRNMFLPLHTQTGIERGITEKTMATTPPPLPRAKLSAMSGLMEFFRHPLTWEKNNGFLNIILGMALFGYCFCTSCNVERSASDVSHKK